MIHISKSPEETQNIAAELIKNIKNFKTNGAIVIALEGELGAGKTVFVKGITKALKIKEKIKSPTFTIMRNYLPAGRQGGHVYHLDCYRLKDENDLMPLGIGEILKNPYNIVLIEWSDRVKKILPKKHIKIHIDHISEKERKILIKL